MYLVFIVENGNSTFINILVFSVQTNPDNLVISKDSKNKTFTDVYWWIL